MAENTASFTKVEFEIVHAVRGRVRLRLKGDFTRELLLKITHHLREQEGILSVRLKQANNSLVVIFEPDTISIKQLTESLQTIGFSQSATELGTQLTKKSPEITYGKLLSLFPPLVGIVITRRLPVSGWQSILTYILAAGLTREVIDLITGASKDSEQVELSPTKQIATTQMATEEAIATLLDVIETDYEIIHQIPGRIRLRIPKISRDFNYVAKLKQRLAQDNRITDIRFKINTNSVVILYDTKTLFNLNLAQLALNDRNGQYASKNR